MRQGFLAILLALLALSCAAAPKELAQPGVLCRDAEVILVSVDDAAGGFGLSSTHEEVVSLLGEPSHEGEGGWWCSTNQGTYREGRSLRLTYEGLSVGLVRQDGAPAFRVRKLELRPGSHVRVAGLRIGDAPDAVLEALGEPHSISTNGDTGNPVWKWRLNSCGDSLHIELGPEGVVRAKASRWCL